MLAALRRAIPRLTQVTLPVQRTLSSEVKKTPIYELREYNIIPSSFSPFMALTNQHIHLRTKYSKLVGYWTAEIGGLNQVVHIWEYDSLKHRAEVRAALSKDNDWMQTYIAKMFPFLQNQQNAYLIPQADMKLPSSSPSAPGVYVLNVERPLPFSGTSALEARKTDFAKNENGVALFQTALSGKGDTGEIVQLLRYNNLDEVEASTARFLSLSDASQTSHAKLLTPTAFSPLK